MHLSRSIWLDIDSSVERPMTEFSIEEFIVFNGISVIETILITKTMRSQPTRLD